ncbi:hypothetical protein C8J57DRAFT_1474628 [Mycena rebaudengoi]|nr:hypothetical protein C8J57DRAFT_1474628 [Mycena rebaudengoi]
MCMIYHIWPMRLTRVLVTDMKETEKLYYDAVEAGELPRDAGTEEELLGLQKKVSEIREDSLRNSLSTWTALGDFFKGHSITLLQCRDEIQRFNTYIEKESDWETGADGYHCVNFGLLSSVDLVKARYIDSTASSISVRLNAANPRGHKMRRPKILPNQQILKIGCLSGSSSTGFTDDGGFAREEALPKPRSCTIPARPHPLLGAICQIIARDPRLVLKFARADYSRPKTAVFIIRFEPL